MKRWTYVLVPVLLLGSLLGWRLVQKREENKAVAGMRQMRKNAPSLVSTEVATLRDIVRTFEATGTVESPQNVKIASKVSGRVDYLELREGDRVKKGQVLVRIDPRQIEAEVHRQSAALAEAQYRLAQAKINQNSTNVGVNAQIRQQKATLTSAEADLRQVKQNYEAQQAAANAGVTDAQAKVKNAEAGIKSAQANLDNSRARLNRILDLYNQGFVAAQDVDDAKAGVSVQESALDIARGQLNSATAQREAAQQQADIVKTKGKADIAASQAKVEQAKASLDFAQANVSQKSAYEQSLAALPAGVESAKASLRSAEAQRADTVLVSPLDGVVTGRHVDPGAMTTPGQPILTVQFVKNVWVTISVPEEISALVHIGQPATVSFDAMPHRSFTGNVVQFNPSADLQNRQFMVRIALDNKQGLFKTGMFARVLLEVERRKDLVCVPKEAVKHDGRGSYVMVAESGKQGDVAHRRDIITGPADPSYTSIAQGLKPGEKVVMLSAFPVKDGAKIINGAGDGSGRGGKPGAGRPGGGGKRGKP